MRLFVVACLGLAFGAVLTWGATSSERQGEVVIGSEPAVTVPVVAEDSSGQANHGIIAGNPILGLPGRVGTSYSFDPPGSWVQVSSAPSLNPGESDFLFSAWVLLDKAPRLRESYDLLRKGHADTPDGEFKLEIIHPGHVRCSAKDSARRGSRVENETINLRDGAWHKVGCARTGQMWSVIVDGHVTSQEAGLGAIGNTFPLAIGSKYGIDDAHQGRLDHVTLIVGEGGGSFGDVAEAIRRLEGSPPTGLWRLDEGAAAADGQG